MAFSQQQRLFDTDAEGRRLEIPGVVKLMLDVDVRDGPFLLRIESILLEDVVAFRLDEEPEYRYVLSDGVPVIDRAANG